MSEIEWEYLCGIPVQTPERDAEELYRNWPGVICTLPGGHESDHVFKRPDGVEYHWPISREDIERLRGTTFMRALPNQPRRK